MHPFKKIHPWNQIEERALSNISSLSSLHHVLWKCFIVILHLDAIFSQIKSQGYHVLHKIKKIFFFNHFTFNPNCLRCYMRWCNEQVNTNHQCLVSAYFTSSPPSLALIPGGVLLHTGSLLSVSGSISLSIVHCEGELYTWIITWISRKCQTLIHWRYCCKK